MKILGVVSGGEWFGPMFMTYLFLGIAAFSVVGACVAGWHLAWVHRLPPRNDAGDEGACGPADRLRCSVVVAARDEEARIEGTVRRLLMQQGVELELIVVNDRSRDRTGEILDLLSREDTRLSVVQVHELPEGWLGKCHACHVGATAATGEWILFTDADCWAKPDVLLRALREADRARVDHVTLTAGPAGGGADLKAGSLLFHLSVANWISGVNRDRPGAHFGIGAFNLVRTAAYRKCGGYEALRLTVLDDVKLGLLLRRAGFKTRAFVGGDDVEAHWGTSLWSSVRLMEKNYFAALEFNLPLALGLLTFLLFLTGVAVLGVVSATPAGLAAAFSPFALTVPAATLARRMGWSPWVALGAPLAFPVFFCALLNSTARTVGQGGVRWRDTFYPLDVLRSGRVR